MERIAGVAVCVAVGCIVAIGPRRCVISAIDVARRANVFALKLRGLTPDDVDDERVLSGQAWCDYCDELKAAGANMLYPGAPRDALTQAEGYRYLTRLLRVSLEAFVEANDPQNPILIATANGFRDAPVKIGSDSPDNLYESAMLADTKLEYRVFGTLGSAFSCGFGTQAGVYGGEGNLRTVSNVDAREFADGSSVEVYLSSLETQSKQKRKNWMRLDASIAKGNFIVRNVFLDRARETPAQLKVEIVGGLNIPSEITSRRLIDALRTSSLFVGGASLMFCEMSRKLKANSTNKLPLFDVETSNNMGGDPAIRYYHSYWSLPQQDDVLLVAARIPSTCVFWNFQINNHWMESLDYKHFSIHVNPRIAAENDPTANGRYTIVVCRENPHIPKTTWLSTTNHTQGQMCFRWIFESGDAAATATYEAPVPRLTTVRELKALML